MNELMRYLRVQWDRVGAVVAAIAGVVVLILGWVGTSGTEYIAEQIPYVMSGGLAGLVLLIVAAALWLSADLRDEWRELAAQGDALRAEREERRGELQAYIDAEVTRRLAAGSRGGDAG